jgi:hypothetical protein
MGILTKLSNEMLTLWHGMNPGQKERTVEYMRAEMAVGTPLPPKPICRTASGGLVLDDGQIIFGTAPPPDPDIDPAVGDVAGEP